MNVIWQSLTLNHPFLRVVNYFIDRPFWHKRWRPVLIDCHSEKKGLLVGGDPEAESKRNNPNWRKEWKWVMLRSRTGNPYHVCVFGTNEGERLGIKKLFPVKTKYVALRVGDQNLLVTLMDSIFSGSDCHVTTPEVIVLEGHDSVFVIDPEEVKREARLWYRDVTFI